MFAKASMCRLAASLAEEPEETFRFGETREAMKGERSQRTGCGRSHDETTLDWGSACLTPEATSGS